LGELAQEAPSLAMPLILLSLQTADKQTCRNAMEALPFLTIAEPEAGKAIFASLFKGEIGDPNSFEPTTQLKKLAQMAPDIAASIIREMMPISRNYASINASSALSILAETDPRIALPLIEEALADDEVSVRNQGALALKPLAAAAPDLAGDPIYRALNDPEDLVLNSARIARRALEKVFKMNSDHSRA
jgi:hypothetical protein